MARIVELLNTAGVERVVHTGDITQAKTLEVFAGLRAPLVGVYGNNDVERKALEEAALAHGFELVDPPLYLDWGGRALVVVHDPRDLETLEGDAAVALHGHTHRFRLDRDATRLTFNPGECAGHLSGYNAVGVLDLACLDAELLKF